MADEQDPKVIPPAAVIIDAISNIVGANVTGHSKRTQYYLFMDVARGNSLQQPYQIWFAKSVLEPLDKVEKRAIHNCSDQDNETRRYRGILIDDPEKAALAESRFSRCKGQFEDLHKETTIFRAYFVLDRVVQKYNVSTEKLNAIPSLTRIINREFDKIFQAYDETLLDIPNAVEDRLQDTLATVLSPPLYGAYFTFDALLYHVLGIATQYPDLEPRQGFSLMIVPGINQFFDVLHIAKKESEIFQPIRIQKLVGLGPLSERQAANIATWLTTNSFSKIKEIIGENGKAIFNNVVAIALGALLSATIVTQFYTPKVATLDPAFVDAIKVAKFDLFTFKNGDLGIVTYEMPQIPERMRYGDVCRISWREVDKVLSRKETGNMMDLADARCQEGFLAAPLKAFYDAHSQVVIENLAELEDRQNPEDVDRPELMEPQTAPLTLGESI